VTCQESWISAGSDFFLINHLSAANNVTCSGWQTPYPQKRQQALGATFARLWKTVESPDLSGFQRGFAVRTNHLIKY
jgi:hypothetical protein